MHDMHKETVEPQHKLIELERQFNVAHDELALYNAHWFFTSASERFKRSATAFQDGRCFALLLSSVKRLSSAGVHGLAASL